MMGMDWVEWLWNLSDQATMSMCGGAAREMLPILVGRPSGSAIGNLGEYLLMCRALDIALLEVD